MTNEERAERKRAYEALPYESDDVGIQPDVVYRDESTAIFQLLDKHKTLFNEFINSLIGHLYFEHVVGSEIDSHEDAIFDFYDDGLGMERHGIHYRADVKFKVPAYSDTVLVEFRLTKGKLAYDEAGVSYIK